MVYLCARTQQIRKRTFKSSHPHKYLRKCTSALGRYLKKHLHPFPEGSREQDRKNRLVLVAARLGQEVAQHYCPSWISLAQLLS